MKKEDESRISVNGSKAHNILCKSSLLEPEKGGVMDFSIKSKEKLRIQEQETLVNKWKYREFLAKRNVLTVKEKISFNQKRFNERFLKSIDTILVDYIQTKFTIKELYIIFFGCCDGYYMTEKGFLLVKQQAIEFINAQNSLSSDEKKSMKGKVWGMNFILFGLILDFVERYRIFDGTTEEMKFLQIN